MIVRALKNHIEAKTGDDFDELSNELSARLMGVMSKKKRAREERKLLLEKRAILYKFLGLEE